ncbi:MAG: ABC transporter substrate-binding protein [Nocardioides sp.]|uniref:ABC transporter substrate-binding protein n=1 Tax=Nocardioides sp. TaxID=35761 RepID=UPI0039E285DE
MNNTDSPFGHPPDDEKNTAGLARRSFLFGALGVAAAAALAACSDKSGGSGGSGSGGSKTDIVVAVSALAASLNGVLDGNGLSLQAFEMNANLQAGLVRNPYIDGETAGTVIQDFNNYVGYVAESYTVSDDGLTYTFVLRKDFKDAMGNPVTADDVVYSFERKWASESYAKASWGDFKGPEAVTKVDDYTVTIEIPSAGFGLTFLGLLANLQGHIYSKTVLDQNKTADDPYAMTWSAKNGGWGLGPYYMESQSADQEMILVANPNYAYGEPSIKKVTLRVVPDAGTRASLVKSGDVILAEDVLPNDQAKLAEDDDLVVPEVSDPIEYVDVTLVCNKAPFDDLKVRQAFQYALPYEQIIEEVYAGRAVPKKGNVNPSTKNFSVDGIQDMVYDVDKAKALLEEAGKSTVDVTLSVSTANQDLINLCLLIKSYAVDAGFNVNVEQLAAADFGTARLQATKQAIIYRNRAQVQTPEYSCITFFKPGDDPSSPSRWSDDLNTQFWVEVDAAREQPDQLNEEAGKHWTRAQEILVEAAAEIFVCAIQPTQVFSKSLTGWAYRSENQNDFGNLEVS